jgi:HK97 family phage prohead protease
MKAPKQKLNRAATPKLERRYLPAQELRVQSAEGGYTTLAGYAAVFNSNSQDMGFIERIAPGAFTANLATDPDVRALVNHDPNLILGRTKSGTLKLTEDNTGLHFECSLPDTQVARDLAVSTARGDIDQCSFGMYVDADTWTDNPDGSWLRTITAASLFDVSAVTYPAYTATSVSVRSLFPDGVPAEVRAKGFPDGFPGDEDEVEPTIPGSTTINIDARGLTPEQTEAATRKQLLATRGTGCDCDCPECAAGNCGECSDPDCDDSECDCSMRSIRKSIETSTLRARIAKSL